MKVRLFRYVIGLLIIAAVCVVNFGCDEDGLPLVIGDGDPAESVDFVTQGIEELEQGDWDAAYSSFAQAVAADPNNGDAVFWYSVCNLASISVDVELRTIMANKLGVIGYPTTMNEVFSPDWFGEDVFVGYVQIYDEVLGYVDDTTQPLYQVMPDINIPTAIAEFEDSDATLVTPAEYLLAVGYNFITNNPIGLNDLVDDVVVDLLGPRLDAAIAAVQAVPADAQITFTWRMFSDGSSVPPSWWPLDAASAPYEFTIGKAELLLEASTLNWIKYILNMGRVWNLSLPLQDYWDNVGPLAIDYSTVNIDTFPWSLVSSPFASGFLGARDSASVSSALDAAKEGFVGFSQSIIDATDLFISRLNTSDTGFTLASDSDIMTNFGFGQSDWDMMETVLIFERVGLTKALNSVNTPGTVYIVPVAMDFAAIGDLNADGFADQWDWFEYYSDDLNWPVAVDWGALDDPDTTGVDESAMPSAIGIDFSVVFSSAIGALSSIIELDSTTGEPEWYKFTFEDALEPFDGTPDTFSRDGDTPVSNVSPAQAESVTELYGIKLKDITFGGLIEFDVDFFQEAKTMLLGQLFGGLETTESDFVVENGDGSIEVFVPFAYPVFAYTSFAAPGTVVTVGEPLNITITTRGSFWFNATDLVVIF